MALVLECGNNTQDKYGKKTVGIVEAYVLVLTGLLVGHTYRPAT
jgi:hypothetical protein